VAGIEGTGGVTALADGVTLAMVTGGGNEEAPLGGAMGSTGDGGDALTGGEAALAVAVDGGEPARE
jgi:hypothetical protein